MAGAVLAVGVATAAWYGVRALGEKEKPANPLAADPMPARLFPSSEYATIESQEAAAAARADADAATWFASHARPDDAAFTRYVDAHVPKPPPLRVLRGELPLLHRLERSRSPERTHVVQWLFLHGKQDIWKLYLRQYRELVGKQRAKPAKRLFKRTLAFANTVNTTLKHTIKEPHPLQLDHSLDPIVPHPGKTKAETIRLDIVKYSFPSNHTNISVALATVLAALEPHRAQEYRWMAGEISYSRLVAGVHWTQDLVAGAYEGRLIGDYEVHYFTGS